MNKKTMAALLCISYILCTGMHYTSKPEDDIQDFIDVSQDLIDLSVKDCHNCSITWNRLSEIYKIYDKKFPEFDIKKKLWDLSLSDNGRGYVFHRGNNFYVGKLYIFRMKIRKHVICIDGTDNKISLFSIYPSRMAKIGKCDY